MTLVKFIDNSIGSIDNDGGSDGGYKSSFLKTLIFVRRLFE